MRWPASVFSKDLNPATIASVGRDPTAISSGGRAVSHSRKSTVVSPNGQGIAILVTSHSWHFATLHSGKSAILTTSHSWHFTAFCSGNCIVMSWHFTTSYSDKLGPAAFDNLITFDRSEFKPTSLFANRLSCSKLDPFWTR